MDGYKTSKAVCLQSAAQIIHIKQELSQNEEDDESYDAKPNSMCTSGMCGMLHQFHIPTFLHMHSVKMLKQVYTFVRQTLSNKPTIEGIHVMFYGYTH